MSAHAKQADWNYLVDTATPTATDRPARFVPELLGALPEPARRWLTHAIAPGTPLASAVELTMRGQIRLGTWRPFTARQILAVPAGFVWAATARVAGLPVVGFDSYLRGTGAMRWRILGLLPVVSEDGPDVTRSAAGRLAAESTALVPTGFRHACWTPGSDDSTAVAVWHIGGDRQAVELHVRPDGGLAGLLMQRWGNPDGQPFGRYPFGVTVEAEQRFHGICIPAVFRAGWWWGTDRQTDGEFFRAEITAATFT
jgi:hypothetical protein